MQRSGEKLRAERLKKGYTLERIEHETKIKKSVLLKIEEGDQDNLPPATFVKGFIRNYAIFLGLDPENILALYRRETDKPDIASSTRPFLTQLSNSFFSITPQRIFFVSIISVILLFLFYFGNLVFSLSSGPSLSIISPKNNEKFSNKNIFITGQTTPDATLFINQSPVSLTAKGEFSKPVILDSGLNKYTIESIDRNNRKTQRSLTIIYNPQ